MVYRTLFVYKMDIDGCNTDTTVWYRTQTTKDVYLFLQPALTRMGAQNPKRYVNMRTLFVVLSLVGLALLLLYQSNISQKIMPEQPTRYVYRRPHLDVAIVCCGNRLQETVVLIKSIALFAGSPVFLHIVVENNLQNRFKSQIKTFPAKYLARVQFQMYDIEYPFPTEAEKTEWKNMFRLCATQRLFLPMILKNVDSVLYLDTDTLLLSHLDPIFAAMTTFNSSHLVAMATEQEPDLPTWYPDHARHPWYGQQGLNSGVMLMNLTRLRALPWIKRLHRYYNKFLKNITYGDQDLLNIYFHFHPGDVYLLTCEWNFRSDYCYLGRNVCKRSESVGVRVLHGNRQVWHNHTVPTFKAVYRTVKNHNMNKPLQPVFGESMMRHLNRSSIGNCTLLSDLLAKTAISLCDDYPISN